MPFFWHGHKCRVQCVSTGMAWQRYCLSKWKWSRPNITIPVYKPFSENDFRRALIGSSTKITFMIFLLVFFIYSAFSAIFFYLSFLSVVGHFVLFVVVVVYFAFATSLDSMSTFFSLLSFRQEWATVWLWWDVIMRMRTNVPMACAVTLCALALLNYISNSIP